MGLTIVLLTIVVVAFALGLVILWDRLVGTALMAAVSGATWTVGQSEGRWWFWPVLVAAVLAVVAAFVIAVLIS